MTTKEYWQAIHKAEKEGCSVCPENRDFDGKLPCGQQNCWIDIYRNRI